MNNGLMLPVEGSAEDINHQQDEEQQGDQQGFSSEEVFHLGSGVVGYLLASSMILRRSFESLMP